MQERKKEVMPFKSKAQMRFLYANYPDIAKRWRKEHPGQNLKKLPEHKKEKRDKDD